VRQRPKEREKEHGSRYPVSTKNLTSSTGRREDTYESGRGHHIGSEKKVMVSTAEKSHGGGSRTARQ